LAPFLTRNASVITPGPLIAIPSLLVTLFRPPRPPRLRRRSPRHPMITERWAKST